MNRLKDIMTFKIWKLTILGNYFLIIKSQERGIDKLNQFLDDIAEKE